MATKQSTPDKVVSTVYESIGDFQRAVAKWASQDDDSNKDQPEFYGTSHNQAMSDLLKGNLPAAAKADALMDSLTDESMDTVGLRLDCSVAGFAPNVPAYLSGDPECMYAYDEVQSESAPIRIFASVCVSAGVGQEAIEKRGVTILALCQKLVQFRPVELYVYADIGQSNTAIMPVIKIEASPLDMATATYALSSCGFLRRLCFRWANKNGWDGHSWAWGKSPNDTDALRKTRAALGLTDTDLHIPGTYLTDPLVNEPVKWINEQIAKYAGIEVAA